MVGFYCRIIFTWASKIEAMYERPCAVANPGEGPGRPDPPTHPHLLLDQTEARKAEKKFLRPHPPLLSYGLDDLPPPPPPLSEGLDPPLACACVVRAS